MKVSCRYILLLSRIILAHTIPCIFLALVDGALLAYVDDDTIVSALTVILFDIIEYGNATNYDITTGNTHNIQIKI